MGAWDQAGASAEMSKNCVMPNGAAHVVFTDPSIQGPPKKCSLEYGQDCSYYSMRLLFISVKLSDKVCVSDFSFGVNLTENDN